MKIGARLERRIIIGGLIVVLSGITVCLMSWSSLYKLTVRLPDGAVTTEFQTPGLVPWNSIGGCGASAAGGSGASYQWMGKGISGALFDMETRLSTSRQTATQWGMGIMKSTTIPLTINYNSPGYIFRTLSVAMPFLWKEKDASRSGGIGDLSLTITKKLGMSGQIGTSLGITLPTGKYDIHDALHRLVESTLQLGGGLFGFSLSTDYSIDRDWGLITFGGSYSGGLLKMKTVEREWDAELDRGTPVKRTLSWARVSKEAYISPDGYDAQDNVVYKQINAGIGAENDYGVMNPDNVSLFFYAARSGEKLMPSAGLAASIPLGNGRKKEIIPMQGSIQLDPVLYPNADAVLSFLDTSYATVDSATRAGGAEFLISGKDPTDPTGSTWIYGKSTYEQKKSWIVLTPGAGIEFQTGVVPMFLAFTLPFELNLDDGIGFNGFSLDIGIKFMLF